MKPIDDIGHALVVSKPFRARRYENGKFPDPGQCVDTIIVGNDRNDGIPRPRWYVSNGASWDPIALLSDLKSPPPAPVDLTPMVRAAVSEMLPAALPVREVKTISAPANTEAQQKMAIAILEFDRLLATQAAVIDELKSRVAFLEQNALAKAQLVKEQ